jgi:3-oxoacyl-[acyl-carrier protein] reductase
VGVLTGRAALVTGVSRRAGIGFTLARRLAADGADVLATGWSPHDAAQAWGADQLRGPGLAATLRDGLPPGGGRIVYREDDLADTEAPVGLVRAAAREFGRLDVLVAAHARSSAYSLADTTAEELDQCWAVNARSTLLLVREMATLGGPGRVVLFTSGQYYCGMPGELPYVATKGALQQMTRSLALELAPTGITVNCVDPGPVDTGYADAATKTRVAGRMPMGRWGTPDDTAELVSWLACDASGWITGQTLASDGGWSARG